MFGLCFNIEGLTKVRILFIFKNYDNRSTSSGIYDMTLLAISGGRFLNGVLGFKERIARLNSMLSLALLTRCRLRTKSWMMLAACSNRSPKAVGFSSRSMNLIIRRSLHFGLMMLEGFMISLFCSLG